MQRSIQMRNFVANHANPDIMATEINVWLSFMASVFLKAMGNINWIII